MRLRKRLPDEDGLLLTPLIDMVFLVVIFFMLNTTFSMNPAIKVDLPAAYTSQAALKDEIVVTLSVNGDIYIGKSSVPAGRFPGELKKEMARLNYSRIILRADEEVKYKLIIEIMDLSRLAGIGAISLVTTRKSLSE